MAELHDLTALEQGAAIAAGEVSSGELVEHYLDRVERLDDVGAFVTVTAEQARERARSLGSTAGSAAGDGPLHGVPTAIKDLNLTAGVRTTFGSAAYDDFVPEVSDGVVLSMEAAGLVSLGKTATPEFGSPCYTEPDGRPPSVTPWDRTRTAGGSSGGAAAAVARKLGLCDEQIEVQMPGGSLMIRIDDDGSVLMRGPVTTVGSMKADPGIFE